VHTGNTNDGGGFLSSWFGYFSRRRDDASAGPPSNEQLIHQSLSQMNKIMMRMEEKLATVSSLECRCEQLEKKCSSLENMLESTSQSTKEHIDKKFKYHEMLIRNQNWKYPVPVRTKDELARAAYDDEETNYIYGTSQMLKRSTEALVRGDFPDADCITCGDKGIHLDVDDGYPSFGDFSNDELSPHWREFAAALKNFKPVFDVLPDDADTFIAFTSVQLTEAMTHLVKDALMNMPFKMFCFQYNLYFHGGTSTIAEMMGNNKCLQKLELQQIEDMNTNDIAELCSAIHRHPSLVDVAFEHCFTSGSGLGDELLHSLLGTDNLKLERLSMPNNHVLGFHNGFNVCTLLSDYLATNPRLKELNLNDNNLDDSDAVLIANALRSNTTLKHLYIGGNHMSDDGAEALKRALYDGSSLNSVADSNHSCYIKADYDLIVNDTILNNSKDREINRAQKLYTLLSIRNKSMSNAQDFGYIDVKLLPNVLEVVQKYSQSMNEDNYYVRGYSIVYEVMRSCTSNL
jgi:hypothetical protein